ncbi:MAG: hypothetical protein ACTSXX_02110 [Candidatus Baldrarchaeia archaeon]
MKEWKCPFCGQVFNNAYDVGEHLTICLYDVMKKIVDFEALREDLKDLDGKSCFRLYRMAREFEKKMNDAELQLFLYPDEYARVFGVECKGECEKCKLKFCASISALKELAFALWAIAESIAHDIKLKLKENAWK